MAKQTHETKTLFRCRPNIFKNNKRGLRNKWDVFGIGQIFNSRNHLYEGMVTDALMTFGSP
jgi:hypothetical protein